MQLVSIIFENIVGTVNCVSYRWIINEFFQLKLNTINLENISFQLNGELATKTM